MAITVHWINPDWKLEKVLLGFVYVNERHTAENISKRVFLVLNEFGISGRILAVVTDGASNMRAACGRLGMLLEKLTTERLRCGRNSGCKLYFIHT